MVSYIRIHIFLLRDNKTNSSDKIFDKVILIIINSSAPVSVTVCKELLIKLQGRMFPQYKQHHKFCSVRKKKGAYAKIKTIFQTSKEPFFGKSQITPMKLKHIQRSPYQQNAADSAFIFILSPLNKLVCSRKLKAFIL